MIFLYPIYFFLLPLVFLPILLSFFKPKYKTQTVSSLYLWKLLLKEREYTHKFKKFFLLLDVFLQMLIIFLLILALTKPNWKLPTSKPVPIFVDLSASLATEGRLALLNEKLHSFFTPFPGRTKVYLYQVGKSVSKVKTIFLMKQLKSFSFQKVYSEPLNLKAIDEELTRLWKREKIKLAFFITDNQISANRLSDLEAFYKKKELDLKIISICPGKTQPNVGITSYSTSISLNGFISVAVGLINFGEREAYVNIYFSPSNSSDYNAITGKRRVFLPVNREIRVTKNIRWGDLEYLDIYFTSTSPFKKYYSSQNNNALKWDDGIRLVKNKTNRIVSFVGKVNYPLVKIFKLKNFIVDIKGKYQEKAKIIVFSGKVNKTLTKKLKDRIFIVLPDAFHLTFKSFFEKRDKGWKKDVVKVVSSQPLMRFVDLEKLKVFTSSTPYSLKKDIPGFQCSPLLYLGEYPLISLLKDEKLNNIYLVFAFPWEDSNFTSLISFPIFWENFFEWVNQSKENIMVAARSEKKMFSPQTSIWAKGQCLLNKEESNTYFDNGWRNHSLSWEVNLKKYFYFDLSPYLYLLLLLLLFLEFLVKIWRLFRYKV